MMHACMHAYIHTYIHTHTHTYIHIYTDIYIDIYIDIHIYKERERDGRLQRGARRRQLRSIVLLYSYKSKNSGRASAAES
jgi:hypothetical protein